MIISHDHRFIFIHIPRTAGTSIEMSLCQAMGINQWRSFIGEPKEVVLASEEAKDLSSLYSDPHRNAFEGRKHITARELRSEIGENQWDAYFKFAFVRNPWDRVLSTYFKKRKEQRRIVRALWPRNKTAFNISLFIKYILFKQVSSQQVDFLTDESGELIVDFVGRFENLEEDFNQVCQAIDIEATLGNNSDATPHSHYTEYYTEWSRQLIADIKRDDIEMFQYGFSRSYHG